MTNYELFDIGVKCAGLGVFFLLLVPPIMRRREPEEESDEAQHDGR